MMNPLKILLSISLCICMVSLMSCGEEEAAVNPDLLIGRWDIEEALRNNKVTESLSDLYYEFSKDGTMKTNLSGATETGKYELDEQTLVVQDTRMDATYQVETLSDSFLVMSTVLQKFNFKLTFQRVIQEE